MCEEELRFAPNGNKLPERLPLGHRLVDTTKTQWLIGPSIGCGGFGDIYLTKQYDERTDRKLDIDSIIAQSNSWTHVIKFEHFSGPLFAEINFYLRVARKETLEDYMASKKLKHLGMPRFIASGIYDPAKSDNPPPICNSISISLKPPAKKSNAVRKAAQAKNNGHRKIPASQHTKEKKYRFLVLQRFGDDLYKIWERSNARFDMTSAFSVALRVIDTLEYIHFHGYVHADVKASNLLIGKNSNLPMEASTATKSSGHLTNGTGTRESSIDSGNGSLESGRRISSRRTVKRKLPPTTEKFSLSKASDCPRKDENTNLKCSVDLSDEIYLIDFGLVEKFNNKEGEHREHVEDQRRANNGTMEFCPRDAHIGAFSRRSDLESLAYNLLYWVSGGRLPWCKTLKDHSLVEVLKKYYMENLEEFVNYCFNEDTEPVDAVQLLKSINSIPPLTTNGRTSCVTGTATATDSTTPKGKTANGKSKKTSALAKVNGIQMSASSSKSSSSSKISNDLNMCNTLYEFLKIISALDFKEEPDYFKLKSVLSDALGKPAGRTARKRGVSSNGNSTASKNNSPKLSKQCENPTPAMREILRKMKLGNKKS